MKPMHATVAVLTALGTWNDVMTPLVIMSGSGMNTLPLAQMTFQTQFGTNYNLAFASYLLEANFKRSSKRSRKIGCHWERRGQSPPFPLKTNITAQNLIHNNSRPYHGKHMPFCSHLSFLLPYIYLYHSQERHLDLHTRRFCLQQALHLLWAG